MWEAVEARIGEVRMGKTEGRRSERGDRKKMEGKRKEKEAEKGKDSRSKEISRGMGNLRQKRGGSEIRDRGKRIGTR